MEEKEFEDLRNNYKNGTTIISVDMAKARQVLMQMGYKPLNNFYYLILLLLLVCCISSFITLGWFGILYTVVYLTIWFSALGSFALPQSSQYGNYIIAVGIIATIATLIFDTSMTFLTVMSFIVLYLSFYLYRFAAKKLINDFILKDVRYFNAWINNIFFIR